MVAATLQLSQGHLQLLEHCPRKFQQTYLEQLQAPIDLEHQAKLDWGSQFHTLMQQYELGLPLPPSSLPVEQSLYEAMHRLLETAGGLFTPRSPQRWRQSEHQRLLAMQGYRLLVIYDLVILDPPLGHIVDWKTYPRPSRRDRLINHWQTRLYPFVLAETSDIAPNHITMTYWFTQVRGDEAASQPQSYDLPYSRDRHEQIRRDLSQILTQLTDWLTAYEHGIPFPQVDPEQGLCATCEYAHRCDRVNADDAPPTSSPQPLLTWDEIAEVPL